MTNRTIKLISLPSRLILISAAIVVLIFVVFVVKWSLAQTVARHTDSKELADFAVTLAPADPQTHLTAAALADKAFAPADLEKSLAEYERAAALAPNNYFLWLELGKARERSDDAAGAEKALRRALALAPNYAVAQWTLGNQLLRQGDNAESFALIRQAALGDPKYVNPAVSVAWQIFAGDAERIRQVFGSAAPVEAALAARLADEKQFTEAARIWNSLAAEDRQNFAARGREILDKMLAAKDFNNALTIYRDLEPNAAADVGKLTNGDFESEIKTEKASVFEWQIAAGGEPQIGVDNQQKHGGEQSLIVAFNSPDGRDFRQITNTVVVEAGAKYILRAFYRANLKTAATVGWEIADAADGAVLGKTDIADATQNDWTELTAEFTAPANTRAVVVRLARAECKIGGICPISGRIWFDDLTLEKR